MNEQDIRAMIASRVRAGILPSEQPSKTFAGTGEGANCDCCGMAITEREVQYEVDFATSLEGPRRTVVAHRDCHRIWQRITETAAPRKRASRNSYAESSRL